MRTIRGCWIRALTGGAVVAFGAEPTVARAQEPRLEPRLAAVAGSATDALGTRSNAVTVAPGLAFRPSRAVAFDLSAQGVRFQHAGWALSAVGASATRHELLPRLALTTSATGSLTGTSNDAQYASAEATPALETAVGPFVAFAGVRGAIGSMRMAEAAGSPRPFPLGGGTSPRVVTRHGTLRGFVWGGGVRFTREEAMGSAGYREERSTIAEVPLVDRVLMADASAGRATLSASVGARASSLGDEAFGSAAVGLRLTHGVALQASAGRYPASHLTGVVGGSFVSVGLVLTGSRAPSMATATAPTALRGVAPPPQGHVRLVMRAPEARRVEVAGDWTRWQPLVARRAPDGYWYADVRLAPGRYRYAFRTDGGPWVAPDGAGTVDDGFGGRSAVLTVQ